MSSLDGSIAQMFPRATAAGRYAAAVVTAGVIGALVWMFVLQEGHTGRIFGVTWTQHDFPDGLGLTFGAEDTARAGLFLTLGLGVIVAAVFALVERRLPGSGLVKGLSFAPLLFLAWGLVFTPLVDSRQVKVEAEFVFLPTGFFGVDAGGRTIISGVLASVLTGIVIARIISLMREAPWWEAHPDAREEIEVAEERMKDAISPLFELPEQRTEQGGERAR